MTLSRLYCENGNRAGFWVQHRAWSNVCAHVQSIGGLRSGTLPAIALLPVSTPPASPLPGTGDNSHADAQLKFYDIRSGRRVQGPPAPERTGERNYQRIAEPFWYVRSVSPTWGNTTPPGDYA